jgi:hypothetical protein
MNHLFKYSNKSLKNILKQRFVYKFTTVFDDREKAAEKAYFNKQDGLII